MDKADILERLRENQLWLHRDGFRTSADNARDAMQTIEAIRAENAALKEQVAQLESDLRSVSRSMREALETIAQQAEALRVKDEAFGPLLKELMDMAVANGAK